MLINVMFINKKTCSALKWVHCCKLPLHVWYGFVVI